MTVQSGGLWRTAYEVDFTSLSSQNIRTGGNGNKTIDGKVWLWGNDGNLTSANVGGGSGIVLVASATATGYYEGANVRNAPNLTIPLSSLFPSGSGYSVGQTAVRVLVRMKLTNADADAEGGKLALEYTTTPENQNFWIAKWYNGGGLKYRVSESLNPTYTTIYADNATSVSDDILSFIWWPPDTYETYTGLFATGETMKLTTERASASQRIATPLMTGAADARLVLCQVTNNVSGTLTTEFTHMRVDYHSKHPAL